MKRPLKRVFIVGAVLFFCLVLTHATWQRFQKHTPKKVYVVPEIEHKKSVKKNENFTHILNRNPLTKKNFFIAQLLRTISLHHWGGNRKNLHLSIA